MISEAFAIVLTCSPGVDFAPQWNAAMEQAVNGPEQTIVLPSGHCETRGGLASIRKGVNVIGQGKSSTVIDCNTNGTCLWVCDQGSRLADFTIWKGAGFSGGHGLAITSCTGEAAGNHNIERVWITSGSGGLWSNGLYIDGSNRAQSPAGMRGVILDDVTVFNGVHWIAVMWNCISCDWRGGGAYQGAGMSRAIAVGGSWSQNLRLDMVYDRAASVVWSGVLR
jgi:hypothetical protein